VPFDGNDEAHRIQVWSATNAALPRSRADFLSFEAKASAAQYIKRQIYCPICAASFQVFGNG
jgi:hypothetical protein